MSDLIERMRLLEIDHEPDGWPAIKMRDVSALCDRIAQLERENAALQAENETLKVTLQTAKSALYTARDSLGHPDNVAIMDRAIEAIQTRERETNDQPT